MKLRIIYLINFRWKYVKFDVVVILYNLHSMTRHCGAGHHKLDEAEQALERNVLEI